MPWPATVDRESKYYTYIIRSSERQFLDREKSKIVMSGGDLR